MKILNASFLKQFPVAMFSRSIAVMLATLYLTLGVVVSVHADSIERILTHETHLPEQYGLFRNWLFFVENGQLLRLDSVDGDPVVVTIPTPLVFENFRSADFEVFDDHLIVSVGGKLFRLKEPEDALVEIDTLIPDPGNIYRPDAEPRVTSPTQLTVYRDHLYFFGFEPVTGCDTSGMWITAVYRLSSALAEPEHVNTNVGRCAWAGHLQSTPSGLVVQSNYYPPSRYPSVFDSVTVSVFEEPTSQPLNQRGNLPTPPAPVTTCGVPGTGPAAWFDGELYFTTRFWAGAGDRSDSDIGPHELQCDRPLHYRVPWQNEPTRYRPNDNRLEYFDIHRLTRFEKLDFRYDPYRAVQYGSSNPVNYTVANNVLYFQAATRGVNKELFRKSTGCEVPQAIELNPNATSEGRSIGEFLGRLWLFADTGSGMALHYLDDDGLSAVSMAADITVPNIPYHSDMPRGFIEFDGGVLFSAKSTSGEMGTYIARIDRDRPSPPSENEPCHNSEPSDPPEPELVPEIYTQFYPFRAEGGVIRQGSLVTLKCEGFLEFDSTLRVRATIVADASGNRERRVLRTCDRNLRPFEGRNLCQVRIKAKRGTTRYSCRVKTLDPDTPTVIKRSVRYVQASNNPN